MILACRHPIWQPYVDGARVRLSKDYEQLQISASAIVIRFVSWVQQVILLV